MDYISWIKAGISSKLKELFYLSALSKWYALLFITLLVFMAISSLVYIHYITYPKLNLQLDKQNIDLFYKDGEFAFK